MKYLYLISTMAICLIACAPSPKSTEKAEEETCINQSETEQAKKAIITIENTDGKEEFFHVVEEMPQYPGGKEGLRKFIKNNSLYPLATPEFNGENVVIAKFFVTKDGNIKSPTTVRGDLELKYKKEALRIIQMMPKWKPGKHRGKAVHTTYTLSVMFRIY